MSSQPEALVAAVAAMCAVAVVIVTGTSVHPSIEPYNTSMLSGFVWGFEQLGGNSRKMQNSLGVSPPVFLHLIAALETHVGLADSKYIAAEVQLAMFLYTCRKGASTREVKEQFQHSTATVSKWVPLTYFNLSLSLIDQLASDIFMSYLMLSSIHRSTRHTLFYPMNTLLFHRR